MRHLQEILVSSAMALGLAASRTQRRGEVRQQLCVVQRPYRQRVPGGTEFLTGSGNAGRGDGNHRALTVGLGMPL